MVLNLLLALVVLSSVTADAVSSSNSELVRETRESVKRHGYRGCGLTAVLLASGLAFGGLWTWYAVQVHEWRFAAIAWTPLVISWTARVGRALVATNRRASEGKL